MKFTLKDEIAYPREEVFAALRDRTPELVSYLQNVERIEVRERSEVGGVVELENWWTGSADDVPRVLRGFLKPEMLVWIDRARWDANQWRCEWEITLNALPDAVTARGYNLYGDEGGVTTIEMNGEFVVHPERIRGIPTFVAKTAAPTIEKFVVGLLEPNLRQTNRAMEQYLDDQG